MNALEAPARLLPRHRAARARRAVEVAPGVRWLRMGAAVRAQPHQPLAAARRCRRGGEPAREGWSIVDCGIDNAATRAAWEERLRDRARRPAGAARHRHPHAPRPHRLRRTGCASAGTRACGSAPPTSASPAWRAAPSAGFGGPLSAALHGACTAWPPIPTAVDGVAARTNYYRNLVPAVPSTLPAPARRRHARDRHRRARASGTATSATAMRPSTWRSHCDRARVLISGDMVLPRISTNVSVIDVEPEADPLTLYLDSIERMRAIDRRRARPALARPAVQGPAHAHRPAAGAPRASASPRRSRPAPTAPQSAFELVPVLFKRTLDLHQMTFAMGESLAHLHALWFRGKLERVDSAPTA